MSSLNQVMQVIDSHQLPTQLYETDCERLGGLIADGLYAWFASETNIVLYSKQLGSIVSSRLFGDNLKDKSLTITYVKELSYGKGKLHFLLVGCSFKTSGLLYVCQLPTLTTVRCIELPNPVSYITTIKNELIDDNQLCDEFKIMSTVLLVGMATGEVYAIDLRHSHIEHQLKNNEIVVNESRPSKLFKIGKNEDCQEVKEMSDDSDCHLAMFINENFYAYCKKQYSGKLHISVSSILYIEEINTVAIGYSTGHFQLRDCKSMRTIYLLKEPKCIVPVTHIGFLEPSDDPNNLCYLWVIQSDNLRLPHATMIALTYEQRIVMPNGSLAYRVYQGNGVKLEMSLKRETGFGRCISALSVCNVNMAKNETDMDEDCEIRLFAMLMEIRQSSDAHPESFMFLFDINQWYKAQMPSSISHFKVSNSYARFVPLPHNVNYVDFNISHKTLRPFGSNFRNNVEELYYPSSIYFECDCLMDTELVRLKHAGVQQEILDQLVEKNWKMLINPNLVFNQCLQANLRPFFWDKSDDYINYSLPDQRSFVVSILVENKMMSVLSACAEEWKNGTYVSSEATILHLVQCLWKHVMVVKQFADKLCVPLFDYSGTHLDKKNKRILNHCLSQMQCVKHFLEDLHNKYGVHVDYSHRVYTLNLVTQYFKAVTCFLNYGLLPESLDKIPDQQTVQCDFTSLIEYANKRRMELGNSQLYLIDAVVNHEHKGFKLIEQWQHEGGEATKGMYPPANVQCLLRIYLNAALTDQVKNYITVYFLIDVCSTQDLNVTIANRMCNYAIEFDVENKILNTLCRASWLLDHDMFEEAMEILSGDKDWAITKDESWDWFHWTVMKLLVFKKEYFWARFYMKLINISITNIDDHKFYINLQIMNNQCFEALHYIRTRSVEEKPILFRYFFDRCKEINKLRCLLEHPWDSDEEDLFYTYLKTLKDPETLSIKIFFLLQRGRYSEAIELNKSLETVNKCKYDDDLTITSLLVRGFYNSVPKITSRCLDGFTAQNVYKKTDIVLKRVNCDTKSFNIMDKIKENTIKLNSPRTLSKPKITGSLQSAKIARKRSPIADSTEIINEKRRKIEDCLLSPPNVKTTDVRAIGKQVLEILNTPLVSKTVASPPVLGYSSILKTGGSSKKHKRVLSIVGSETPISKMTLRFSLPNENDSGKEQRRSTVECVDLMKDDNPENESFYSAASSNETSRNVIDEQQMETNNITQTNDGYAYEVDQTIPSLEEANDVDHEQMDVTENYSIHAEQQSNVDYTLNTTEIPILSKPNVIELVDLSEEEEEQQLDEAYNDEALGKSYNQNVLFDSELNKPYVKSDVHSTGVDTPLMEISIGQAYSLSNRREELSLCAESNQFATELVQSDNFDDNVYKLVTVPPNNDVAQEQKSLNVSSFEQKPYHTEPESKNTYNDDDVVYLDTEDEDDVDVNSSTSSSEQSLDETSVTDDESELEKTRYGRFKSQGSTINKPFDEKEKYEDSDIEEVDIYSRGEEENEIEIEAEEEIEIEIEAEEEEEEEDDDIVAIERNQSNEKPYSLESDEERFNYPPEVEEEEEEEESVESVDTRSDSFEKNTDESNNTHVSQGNLDSTSKNQEDKSNDSSIIECESIHSESNPISVANDESNFEHHNDDNNDYEYQQDNLVEQCDVANPSENEIDLSTVEVDNNDLINIQSEIDLSQPADIDVNEPNTFLFGQQDTSDNKPVLLFGQVYSLQNETPAVSTSESETKAYTLLQNSNTEINPNMECEETEVVEDMKDILELESLPDSNPDDHMETHSLRSRSTSLQPESLDPIIENVPTLEYPSLQPQSECTRGIESSETFVVDKQNIVYGNINQPYVLLDKCDSLNVAVQMQNDNNKTLTIDVDTYSLISSVDDRSTIKSCSSSASIEVIAVKKTRRSVRAASEDKTMRNTVVTPRSKRAKSVTVFSMANRSKIETIAESGSKTPSQSLVCENIITEEIAATDNIVQHSLVKTPTKTSDPQPSDEVTPLKKTRRSIRAASEDKTMKITTTPRSKRAKSVTVFPPANQSILESHPEISSPTTFVLEGVPSQSAEETEIVVPVTTATKTSDPQPSDEVTPLKKTRRSIRGGSEDKAMKIATTPRSKRAKSIAVVCPPAIEPIPETSSQTDENKPLTHVDVCQNIITEEAEIGVTENIAQKSLIDTLIKTSSGTEPSDDTTLPLRKPRRSVRAASEDKTTRITITPRSKRARSVTFHESTTKPDDKTHSQTIVGLKGAPASSVTSDDDVTQQPTLVKTSTKKTDVQPSSDGIVAKNTRRSIRVTSEDKPTNSSIVHRLEHTESTTESPPPPVKPSVVEHEVTKKPSALKKGTPSKSTKGKSDSLVQHDTLDKEIEKRSGGDTSLMGHQPCTSKMDYAAVGDESNTQAESDFVIKTRSKGKPDRKTIQLEDNNSFNPFRSSGMVEDSSRQKRVSLSKNKSKSHENLAQPKRRSVRSKSLTPVEEPKPGRKTVFGLEQIPEEESCNSEKNAVAKPERGVGPKKSKFNFGPTKLKKHSELVDSNVVESTHQEIQDETTPPKRSKSMQPAGPALTFSAVKNKMKRSSSSVNLKVSDDKSPSKNDDFLPALKKALVSPKKTTKKRSMPESANLKKKRKLTADSHPKIPDPVSESSPDRSDASSLLLGKLSPITGDAAPRHMMLYTPAKKSRKLEAELESESDELPLSSDESTSSKQIMTRSMSRNVSFAESDINESMVKNKRSPSVSDSVSTMSPIRAGGKQTRKSTSSKKVTTEVRISSDTDASTSAKSVPKSTKSKVSTTRYSPEPEVPTNERRMTRLQQSVIERASQSMSVIEHEHTTVNQPTTIGQKVKKQSKKKS
ncbi:protein ELYS-like isoform X2 [Adelges cooleyi]|uniref:protein ELYS-like isoform X2 n=1 Tax=Adelges cooleyi TaxID=133065 RepID=UPI0021806011|nr:protein ELYS-like isoform X2 [Adelges cooleyi]